MMHRIVFRRVQSLARTSSRCWASNVPFLLADIGEGIQEVEILRWHVAVGDTLHQFDKVCEVQSDKAVVEITSRYEGVITSLADSEIVKVGQPLLHMTTEDDDDATSEDSTGSASSSDSSNEMKESDTSIGIQSDSNQVETDGADVHNTSTRLVTASTETSSLQMSPAVRKLIYDNSIDTRKLKGTGPSGRVLKADVLRLLEVDGPPAATHTNRTQTQHDDLQTNS